MIQILVLLLLAVPSLVHGSRPPLLHNVSFTTLQNITNIRLLHHRRARLPCPLCLPVPETPLVTLTPALTPMVTPALTPMVAPALVQSAIIQEACCPESMVLSADGTQCIGASLCPPSILCPPGTRSAPDGNCVAEATPRCVCPSGTRPHPQSQQCVSRLTQQADLQCPPQMTLQLPTPSSRSSFETPVCIQSIQPPPSCPPGFRRTNQNLCEAKTNPSLSCPPGAVQSGQHCLIKDLLPPSVACPHGSSLEKQFDEGQGEENSSDRARCVILHQESPHCPSSYRMDEGGRECIRLVPQTALPCPQGGRESGSFCEQVERFPASFECAPGSVLSEAENGRKQCVSEVQLPPLCPPGFRLIQPYPSTSEMCMKTAEREPLCPEGSEWVGADGQSSAHCRIARHRDLRVCCPSGFELNEDSSVCFRREEVNPRLSCDADCFEVHTYNPSFVCPPKHDLRLQSPYSPMCTPQRNCNRCLKAPLRAAQKRANEQLATHAHVERGDTDPVERGVAPLVKASGVQESVARNSTLLAADLARRAARLVLQSSESVRAAKRDLTADRREAQECLPQDPPCLEETSTNDLVPASVFCPDGGELVASSDETFPPTGRTSSDGGVGSPLCVRKVPLTPQLSCPFGILDETRQKCVREVSVPPKTQCPPGTTRDGLSCLEFERVAPLLVCPPSFEPDEGGRCVALVSPQIQSPKRVSTPALPRCNGPDQVLSNECECVRTLRVPQAVDCPSGSIPFSSYASKTSKSKANMASYQDRCVLSAPLIVPPPVQKTVVPAFVCPDGRTPDPLTRQCVSTRTVDVLASCPNGFERVGESCIQQVEAQLAPAEVVTKAPYAVCPRGMSLEGGSQCVAIRRVAPTRVCPSQFFLAANQRCVRSVPASEICPSGSTSTPEGCLRAVSVAPIIRVIQGCTNAPYNRPCNP